MRHRCRVYSGPIQVRWMADAVRAAGPRFSNVLEGTEHVHFDYNDEGDGWGVIGADSRLAAVLYPRAPLAQQLIRVERLRGVSLAHTADPDCAPDADGICACGVYHGDPCAGCGGRGFHRIENCDGTAAEAARKEIE